MEYSRLSRYVSFLKIAGIKVVRMQLNLIKALLTFERKQKCVTFY